jgi:hypothetical protein
LPRAIAASIIREQNYDRNFSIRTLVIVVFNDGYRADAVRNCR